MKVKEFLTSRYRWCKGRMAIDSKGNKVNYNSPHASRFCLVGAINKCYIDNNTKDVVFTKIEKYLNLPSRLYISGSIGKWNDKKKTTFKDVRKLIEDLDI